MITHPMYTFDKFRNIATIVMSSLAGCLMGFPMIAHIGGVAPLFGALLGGMVGYRRRGDHWFFYVSCVAVLSMALLVSTSMSS